MALLCVCAAWVIVVGHGAPAFGNPSGITNIFRPLSQPAQEIKELSLLVIAICATIFLPYWELIPFPTVIRPHLRG